MSLDQVRNPQEDLFDFDDLLLGSLVPPHPEPQPYSPLPAREARPAPRMQAEPAAAAAPAPAPVAEAPAPQAPAAAPAPIIVQAPAVTVPPATVVVQAQPQRSQTPLVAAFVLLNLCFAALSWRSFSTVQSVVADSAAALASRPGPAPANVEPAPVQALVETLLPVETVYAPPLEFELHLTDGGAALGLAMEALDQGRFDLARQRLFGVLAVIDRYDLGVREDLEARASFLLGECWRREAEGAERAQRTAADAVEAAKETWR